MLKFDFHTYVDSFLNPESYQKYMNRKEEIKEKFQKQEMTGWTERIEDALVTDIKRTAEEIKNQFDCLVVIGIGGSFLGSYAFHKMQKKYFEDNHFEVIYAGTTLSSEYLDELVEYLKNKNFCLNVISKSGTTMETTITYQVLKELLKRKYDEEEIIKHIIVTTDKEKGKLREEVKEKGYKSFIIPDKIGGRYSFLTPAHLLPLAINYNLDEIITGYERGKRLEEYAYQYAVIRNLLFQQGKTVENFCIYEEKMDAFTEWLKQLFGETEGKNGKGIFPTSTVHTRDLHSLGQFIQEGNKILFETFLKIEETDHYISYNNRSLHEINNIVEESVMKAHYSGGVPCLEIILQKLDSQTVASIIYFFQLAAAYSALLLDVNPFDQPGVEVYKKEVRDSLEA